MTTSSVNSIPVECENMISKLITNFWAAEQSYTDMFALCTRTNIGLLGFAEYFHLCALRTGTLAKKLLSYQISHGGQVNVSEVKKMVEMPPQKDITVEKLMLIAFDMEKMLDELMNETNLMAKSKNDNKTSEFMENNLIPFQSHMLQTIQNHIHGLNESENVWLYDSLTMKPFVSKIYQMTEVNQLTKYTSSCAIRETTTKEPTIPNWNRESLEAFANCLLH